MKYLSILNQCAHFFTLKMNNEFDRWQPFLILCESGWKHTCTFPCWSECDWIYLKCSCFTGLEHTKSHRDYDLPVVRNLNKRNYFFYPIGVTKNLPNFYFFLAFSVIKYMHNKTRAHLTIDHAIIELKCDKSPYIAAILCDKSAILIFF